MLALFRTNQLFLSVLLIFYVAGLHIASFIFPANTATSTPGVLSISLINWIGTEGLTAEVVTIGLLLLQATLINIIVATNRLTAEVNLFPGVFYLLVASLIPEFIHLSPLHIANTFYIIVFMELMSTYKKPSAPDRIFNAGFWAAIASFFYFSYYSLLILVFVALNVLRAFNMREQFIFIIGAIVPHILLGVYFFWYGQFNFFIQKQFVENLAFLDFPTLNGYLDYLKIALLGGLILICMLNYGNYTFRQNIQVQKKITILFWGLFITSFSIFFQSGMMLDHLLILAVPLGILLSFNFTKMSNQGAEVFHLLLLTLVLLLQFLPYFSII